MGARREGEKTTCLLDFFRVRFSVWEEVFLGVGYGFEEFGLVLGSDKFDVLLEAEHEF